MSITFKCEHCGRKIEAPDAAGGKWGKCPGCKNKVYVPSKEGEEEGELRLAPLDTEEEKRRREMLVEEARLRQEILKETETSEDGVAPKKEQNETKPGALSDAEIETVIIAYLRQMADGELEEAERTAKSLIPSGNRTIKILERIALSEIPEPEIMDIPHNVLAGLIKSLRGRFK
jgi:DNA-directed RNA polymerase subunit RPC12/RpoP